MKMYRRTELFHRPMDIVLSKPMYISELVKRNAWPHSQHFRIHTANTVQKNLNLVVFIGAQLLSFWGGCRERMQRLKCGSPAD